MCRGSVPDVPSKMFLMCRASVPDVPMKAAPDVPDFCS
jgi:hypothetical protein